MAKLHTGPTRGGSRWCCPCHVAREWGEGLGDVAWKWRAQVGGAQLNAYGPRRAVWGAAYRCSWAM